MWVDCLVLSAIGVAVLSGLVTLHRNQAFFAHFRLCDLVRRRIDGWLYVGNSITTASCCVDLYLRFRLMLIGSTPNEAYFWALSLFMAIGISIFHVTTNMLLQDSVFCDRCHQSWDHEDRKKWTSKEVG